MSFPTDDEPSLPPARWHWSREEMRDLGRRVADAIADYLADLPEKPVFTPVPPDVGQAFASVPPPRTGTPIDELLEEFRRSVAPYPFGNGHPRFHGWVNPPPHVVGVVASALAAAMNPSVAGGNHAAVHLEHQVVRWFRELAGFPEASRGLLVSGGSVATLTALTVARHVAAARGGIDVRASGLQGHSRRLVLYVGEETHSCVRKSAELLGIGSNNIRVVPSDDRWRMRVDLLRETLASDLRDGAIPVAVAASVGTVNTGAIDPIAELVDLCAEHGVWLHVDGAYGAPAALLLDRYRDVAAALTRVDSLALDPHKWLYVPVDAGLVLIRDGDAARDAFSLVPPYLRTDDDPHGVGGPVWFSEYGFDQTRPFRALKVWMMLRYFGVEGYRELIAHDIAMAERLADTVREHPDLELMAHGLSIVCFRYRPAGTPAGPELDELNRRLLRTLQLGGRSFLSGTTVRGGFALRACVVNPGTREEDVEALVSEVLSTAGPHA